MMIIIYYGHHILIWHFIRRCQGVSQLETVDTLVIGSGTGGYVAAQRSAQLGMKTSAENAVRKIKMNRYKELHV